MRAGDVLVLVGRDREPSSPAATSTLLGAPDAVGGRRPRSPTRTRPPATGGCTRRSAAASCVVPRRQRGRPRRRRRRDGIAGRLGADGRHRCRARRPATALFAESTGRFVVEVAAATSTGSLASSPRPVDRLGPVTAEPVLTLPASRDAPTDRRVDAPVEVADGRSPDGTVLDEPAARPLGRSPARAPTATATSCFALDLAGAEPPTVLLAEPIAEPDAARRGRASSSPPAGSATPTPSAPGGCWRSSSRRRRLGDALRGVRRRRRAR